MAKRPFRNRLNDLSTKEWIKFQKSWFIHNPPPRRSEVLQHPAKFPETLAQEFIEFFTKAGQTVLDPMAGTGSALVASLRSGRNAYGIELNSEYAEIGRSILEDERADLGQAASDLQARLITGDARNLLEFDLPEVDYVITSPPYWDMLHARGAETQKERRTDEDLDVVYSEAEADLGNVEDYKKFLDELVSIYEPLPSLLRPRAYITVIVKNVKKGGTIYPLAWDLARRLSQFLTLKDEKIWCQDNVRLAPYGMGNAWVSNTFHHYCLQFRYEPNEES
ncbi:MAG: DNA methyltransferase [Anaerolineales bacterium]